MPASTTILEAAYTRAHGAAPAAGTLVMLIAGFAGPTAVGDPAIVVGAAPSISASGPLGGFNDLVIFGLDPVSNTYNAFVVNSAAYTAYVA
jgi:hypothetical protein